MNLIDMIRQAVRGSFECDPEVNPSAMASCSNLVLLACNVDEVIKEMRAFDETDDVQGATVLEWADKLEGIDER